MMIPRKPFGRTGHESSRVIFGAAALSDVSQADADRTIDAVIAAGINHFDTAASYGDSEVRLGPWVKHHRNEIFLASKTGIRTASEAYEEIQRSLERLQTDHLDLIQLHNLVDNDEWEVATGAGGSLEAAIRARDEGLVKFIGVTGHGVEVAAQHSKSLLRFDFDSVLLPYSYVMMQNPQYAADFADLYDTCQQRNVAMQTIKAVTRRPWGEQKPDTSTWYDPLRDREGLGLAINWVLGDGNVFLNTLGDINILPTVLDLAQDLIGRPDNDQMDALVAKYEMEPLFV
jgi:aryl-alcohol dehydrogenase-like predicted oxidoreductase